MRNVVASVNYETAGLDLLFGGAICFFGFSLWKMATGRGANDPDVANPHNAALTNKAVIAELDARKILSGDVKKKVTKMYEIPNDRRIANGLIKKYTVEFEDNKILYLYARQPPTVDGNMYLQPWGSSSRSFPKGAQ